MLTCLNVRSHIFLNLMAFHTPSCSDATNDIRACEILFLHETADKVKLCNVLEIWKSILKYIYIFNMFSKYFTLY